MAYFESRRRYGGESLRPTAYDRASSLILALLALVGCIVLVLFGLWVMPHQPEPYYTVYTPKWVEPGEGETQPPSDLVTPDLKELGLFVAYPNIISEFPEYVDQVANTDISGTGGDGVGNGNGRETGPPDDVIDQADRWEIRYEAGSVRAYAAQLDHFGIELGAVGGGLKNVDYASNLTAAKPATRSQSGDKEERLYMSWRAGQLKAWDEQLLRHAGVPLDRRVVLQFYPAETEAKLAELEAIHANGRPLRDIKKTIYGVRPSGDSFEYYVTEQLYR